MRIDRLKNQCTLIQTDNNQIAIAGKSANELIELYGSPLYCYSEKIIRHQCRRIKNAVSYPNFIVNYSMKANSLIAILKIMREEGLCVDVMSPGEIHSAHCAGFKEDEIFFVANNVWVDEFRYAVHHKIRCSVDSLSQLELFGKNFPNGKVAVRINPGIGDGHHQKVITGGDKTKFGIPISQISSIQEISAKYNLTINGLNIHIGSNFSNCDRYIIAAQRLSEIALNFKELEFLDVGGGLGINYKNDSDGVDVEQWGKSVDKIIASFTQAYGKEIKFFVEPGRFLVAESSFLLTRVCARKENLGRTFIGTDCGFNVLMRPVLYGAYHEIVNCNNVKGELETVDICGNICESGDILAEEREMPKIAIGDILAVLDAGAYCSSMASNYNSRLRPAEIIINELGQIELIRKRDTINDIVANQLF